MSEGRCTKCSLSLSGFSSIAWCLADNCPSQEGGEDPRMTLTLADMPEYRGEPGTLGKLAHSSL